MTTNNSLDISLIVPAYNEEESIKECVEEANGVLENLKRSYEIIVIDDGSTDETFKRLMETKKTVPFLRAIRFDHNLGQSAAIAAGIDNSHGDIILTIDADMQNDPADIPKLLDIMDKWDAVCGWRKKREDSFVCRASSVIANTVRNWLSNETIRDTGCGLKAFRREYLKRIKLFTGMHRFLPTLMRLEGARVTEIPVNHRPRLKGVSKYGIGNRLFRGLRDLFAIRWMQSRYIRYKIKEKLE